MSFGPTLVATKGWFDEQVAANYSRAVELCADRGPCAEAAAARYGMATVTELRGQFERTETTTSCPTGHGVGLPALRDPAGKHDADLIEGVLIVGAGPLHDLIKGRAATICL